MDGSESPKSTQEMSSLLNATYFRAKMWPNVKPFVNGFLTEQIFLLQYSCANMLVKHASIQEKDLLVVKEFSPNLYEHLKGLNSQLKRIPVPYLFQTAYTTAQFGTFDFLKQWIKDRNGGIPLALHQEACCGMISGGIASCISYPLHPYVNPNSNLRSLLHPLYLQARKEGFLALWKGSGHHIRNHAFLNMGLLTSYNRSLSFFQSSVGLSNTGSHIGAGIFSAFCAATCSSTYVNIIITDEHIRKRYGDLNYSTRLRLLVETMVLKHKRGEPGALLRAMRYTPSVVIAWLTLESIREFEETMGY